MRRIAGAAAIILAAAACDHSEPFGSTPDTAGGPLQPGNPTRLTLNPLQDLNPGWLPDGSAILYTFERSPVANRDRCLGLMPAGGGTRTRDICNTSDGQLDSTEALGPAAVSLSGRLAYGYAQSVPNALKPDRYQLRMAPLTDPENFQVIESFPLNIGGQQVGALGAVRWLSDTRLVYLAQQIAYIPPATRAPPDTVPTGVGLVLVDLATNLPPALVPGTAFATSLAVAPEPEMLLFTVAGESTVHRIDLASGRDSIIHDFQALGIARDVALSGDRLLAVVGGAVSFTLDPVLGPVQRDHGGPVYEVDLATGRESLLGGGSTTHVFRRPAVSAAGAVVVEAYRFTVTGGGPVVERVGDLWEYLAP